MGGNLARVVVAAVVGGALATAALAGCSGRGGAGSTTSSPRGPGTSTALGSTVPVVTESTRPEAPPPAAGPSLPVAPRPGDEPAVVAPPTTAPAAQLAPDAAAGTLRFTQVHVLAGADRAFSGRANTTNVGPDYRNGLTIRWTIVDRGGAVLDEGRAVVSSLAPGATTTIELDGSRPFEPAWASVRFAEA